VWKVYADYRRWPRLSPTIKDVRLIRREGFKQVLEVDHFEGKDHQRAHHPTIR
jgi:polyketide cyclase/dehydrase/lipid transport protein